MKNSQGNETALSEEEATKIIKAICFEETLEETYKIMSWMTAARIGEIALNAVLEGELCIKGLRKNGEPIFSAPKKDKT